MIQEPTPQVDISEDMPEQGVGDEQDVQMEDKQLEITKLQDTLDQAHLKILHKEKRELRNTVEKATRHKESELSRRPPRIIAQDMGK